MLLQRLKTYYRVQAAEPERETVYVSITEKLREICPVEILNISLCNPPFLSSLRAEWTSSNVKERERKTGKQADRQTDGMGGDVSSCCFPSRHRENRCLQRDKSDKITFQEALTQNNPTRSA